jgi:hypothetical protein
MRRGAVVQRGPQVRAIVPAPAHTYASLVGLTEDAARASPRALAARRLHARVR